MTERLHPVRLVHQHLRRAASLLEQRQFDAATAEVDAALAIDPASLTGRTLQDKIKAARLVRPVAPRAHAPSPLLTSPANDSAGASARLDEPFGAPEPVHGSVDDSAIVDRPAGAWPDADASAVALTKAERFIPSGVDAESWLGFEQRIQERRFKALLETVAVAIRAGDGIGARLALEEARELRPDAPELDVAVDQLAVMPPLAPVAATRSRAGMRALGAVSMLACGIALLVGLDAMRTTADVVPASVPAPETVTPIAQPRADMVIPKMADVPLPLLAVPLASGETVGTAGVRPALAIEPQVQFTEPILRPVTLVERILPPVGEIPDDYVAPASGPAVRDVPAPATQPARTPTLPSRESSSSTPAATPAPSAAPTLSASSLGGGSSILAPLSPPTAAPAAAAAVVAPRADETGVNQVLNQYARAYDRLDASAARAVWPTVDERALARAFAGLQSQNVSFDSCDIDIRGVTANASCRGQASYVGKVGSRETRTEARQWRFELRRDGDAWKIESAEARRVSSY